MQFIKQRTSLPIQNVEFSFQSKISLIKRHSKLLPNSIRCIICGPSNCGKTNVIISLIINPNGLRFENIYVYSKTLNQSKYKYLEKILKPIRGLGFYTFTSNDDIISPADAKQNSIIIFDDIICDKQNNVRKYFCMGRHQNIDCFYLAQTYTSIPKHLIRDNANLIILFKQDETNLKHIYKDYSIGSDMKFDKFYDICSKCWKDKYGFMVIDVDSAFNKGRYRRGFDEFIIL